MSSSLSRDDARRRQRTAALSLMMVVGRDPDGWYDPSFQIAPAVAEASSSSLTAAALVAPTEITAYSYDTAISPAASLANLLLENAQGVMMTTTNLFTDEKAEASFFADLAHICTDFVNVLTESTAVVRLSVVVGRIFGIAADWLPDHYIRQMDYFFDAILVSVSLGLFIKSVLPLSYGLFVPTNHRDEEVYKVLFQPAGVTWLQFKALNAVAIDWVDIPPNTLLVNETGHVDDIPSTPSNAEDEECSILTSTYHHHQKMVMACDHDALYWLYQGDSVITFNDFSIPYIHRDPEQDVHDPGTTGFIGIVRFLEKIDKVYSKVETETGIVFPSYAISTGERGAKLIRFDANRLQDLMANDEPLASSLRALLLRGLQRKMGYMLLLLSDELRESKSQKMIGQAVYYYSNGDGQHFPNGEGLVAVEELSKTIE